MEYGGEKKAFMVYRWALARRQKKADLLPEKSCQGIFKEGAMYDDNKELSIPYHVVLQC